MGLKLHGLVTLVDFCESPFRSIVCRIEEFKRILNIMNALAKENKAVIVTSFIEEVLSLLKACRTPPSLFNVVQDLLNVENSLIGLIRRL